MASNTQAQFTVISCLRIAVDADVSVLSTLFAHVGCVNQTKRKMAHEWMAHHALVDIHKTNMVEYVCGFHSTMDKC